MFLCPLISQLNGQRRSQAFPAHRAPQPAWWSSEETACMWPTLGTLRWCWGSRMTPQSRSSGRWRSHKTTSPSYPERGSESKAWGAGKVQHTQDTLPLLKYNINVDSVLPCSLLPALEREIFLQLVPHVIAQNINHHKAPTAENISAADSHHNML